MTNAVNIASLGAAMNADSSGNVAIGTSTPAYKLDVVSTVSDGGVQISGGASGANIFLNNTGTGGRKYRVYSTGSSNAVGAGYWGVYDETANLFRMGIDSSGRVITPSQPYLYFRPSCTSSSGDFNIASGVVSQGGMAYSTSARTITVPVAGVYMITWQTICTNSSVRTDTVVSYNGGNLTQGLSEDSTSGYHQRTHTIAYKMNANDYISLNNANWYNVNGDPGAWSTFSIYLLG